MTKWPWEQTEEDTDSLIKTSIHTVGQPSPTVDWRGLCQKLSSASYMDPEENWDNQNQDSHESYLTA